MRIINCKKIPTDIISKTLIGVTPDGQAKNLIKIDQVDQFLSIGKNKAHIRLQLFNDKESIVDSFFFSMDEVVELSEAYLQTTEGNMKLFEWEMALIQEKPDFNRFISTISKEYFQTELEYSGFKVI